MEILRIAAMVLIVMHHYAFHGFDTTALPLMRDRFIVDWFNVGGKLGVNIFVLISAWFMCESTFTLRKLLKLEGEIRFYSVFFLLITGLPSSFQEGFHYFFPVLYGQNWFTTTFVYLMLLTPVLNQALHQINRMQLKYMIMGALILTCIFPIAGDTSSEMNNMLFFILLYIIGGYLRIYHRESNPERHLINAGILYILLIIFYIYKPAYMYSNSILAIWPAIELLLWAVNRKPSYNKVINTIASTTFGIYLIHEHPKIKTLIWNSCSQYYGTGYLILYAVISCALVFLVCSLIDLIRQYTVEKLWVKALDKGAEAFILTTLKDISYGMTRMADILNVFTGRKKMSFELTSSFLISILLFLIGIIPVTLTETAGTTEAFYQIIRHTAAALTVYVPLFLAVSAMVHEALVYLRRMKNRRRSLIIVLVFIILAVISEILITRIFQTSYRGLIAAFLNDSLESYFILIVSFIPSLLLFRFLN